MRGWFLMVAVVFVTLTTGTVAMAGVARGRGEDRRPDTSVRSAAQKGIDGPATLNGVDQFPIYQRLGVGIWNTTVFWNRVDTLKPRHPTNPADPAYHWPAGLGAAVHDAERHGMKVVIEIRDTPKWASGHPRPTFVPTQPAYLAQFVTALAREYPTVHLWQIYAEPNRRGTFQPETAMTSVHEQTLTPQQAQAPRLYARMLDASYGALKALNRRNLVIGGCTFTGGSILPWLWIKYMRLPDGRPPRMDLYAHNPFSYRDPSLRNHAFGYGRYDLSDVGRFYKYLNQNLARYGHAIRIYYAEWTIPTAPFDPEFNFYTTLAKQAQFIGDAWRIVRSHPQWVYGLTWAYLRDEPGITSGGLEFANAKPKPGLTAWRDG